MTPCTVILFLLLMSITVTPAHLSCPYARSSEIQQPHQRSLFPLFDPFRLAAIVNASLFQQQLFSLEKYLVQSNMTTSSPELRATSSNPHHQQLIRNGVIAGQAVKFATLQSKPSFEDFIDFQLAGNLAISFRATPLQGLCRALPKCLEIQKISGIEYRRPDGACNNRLAPHLGMATGGYFREVLSMAYYDDFFDHERSMSVDRVTKLPSAREVSVRLHGKQHRHDSAMNLMFMQYGQFTAHDFTEIINFRPLQRLELNEGYDCCSPTILTDGTILHPECYAIPVPSNDDFFPQHGIKCLNFMRAAPVPPWDCAIASREQMNSQTSFIDLSSMYGSDEYRVNSLRSFESGQLADISLHEQAYPTLVTNATECSIIQPSPYSCFKTGDDRGNMHIQIVVMHVMFLRVHNQVARRLAGLNPHWRDERLFQETRRIMSGMHQHILYGHYLPLLIGPEFMHKHDLYPRKEGYYTGYSSLVDPGAVLAVSTSAFRLHNQIVGKLETYSPGGKGDVPVKSGKIMFSDTYFDPSLLFQSSSSLDDVINGLLMQPMAHPDRHMTPEVTHKLFHPPGKEYGSDLASIDIQRGRDVGLSGFNSWKQYCGETKFVDFDNMLRQPDGFDADFVQRLKELYVNVDDVDFWSAGIQEGRVEGGVVGRTFACLIAFHFARLKRGDRFFYENPMTGTAFTGSQLREVRKATMSRIICDGGDDVNFVPQNPFMFPSQSNPLVRCSDEKDVPLIDLTPWKEERRYDNYLPVQG